MCYMSYFENMMVKELTHKEVLEKALANSDVKREYDALEPEFELRRALIYLRHSMNLSQRDLANMAGTRQEYISRVEQGKVEMTLPYFARIVKALDADIEITLKPKKGGKPIKIRISE